LITQNTELLNFCEESQSENSQPQHSNQQPTNYHKPKPLKQPFTSMSGREREKSGAPLKPSDRASNVSPQEDRHITRSGIVRGPLDSPPVSRIPTPKVPTTPLPESRQPEIKYEAISSPSVPGGFAGPGMARPTAPSAQPSKKEEKSEEAQVSAMLTTVETDSKEGDGLGEKVSPDLPKSSSTSLKGKTIELEPYEPYEFGDTSEESEAEVNLNSDDGAAKAPEIESWKERSARYALYITALRKTRSEARRQQKINATRLEDKTEALDKRKIAILDLESRLKAAVKAKEEALKAKEIQDASLAIYQNMVKDRDDWIAKDRLEDEARKEEIVQLKKEKQDVEDALHQQELANKPLLTLQSDLNKLKNLISEKEKETQDWETAYHNAEKEKASVIDANIQWREKSERQVKAEKESMDRLSHEIAALKKQIDIEQAARVVAEGNATYESKQSTLYTKQIVGLNTRIKDLEKQLSSVQSRSTTTSTAIQPTTPPTTVTPLPVVKITTPKPATPPPTTRKPPTADSDSSDSESEMGKDTTDSVERFNETGNYKAQNWINSLKLYFEMNDTKFPEKDSTGAPLSAEEEKALSRKKVSTALARISTSSPAWRWVESLLKKGGDPTGIRTSWDLFEENFLRNYGNSLQTEEEHNKWAVLRQQPSEAVSEYTAQARILASSLKYDLAEPSIRRKFWTGLHDSIKEAMIQLDKYDEETTSFDDIAKGAQKTEKNLVRIKAYKKGGDKESGERQSYNNNVNRWSYDNNNNNNYRQGRGIQRRGGSRGNRNRGSYNNSYNNNRSSYNNSSNNPPKRDKSEVECYKCKGKGHYAHECTQKQTKVVINNNNIPSNNKDDSRKDRDMSHIKCYNCDGMGHMANTCRKPKKDKQKGTMRALLDEVNGGMELTESEDEEGEVDHDDEWEILQKIFEQQNGGDSGKED
jgi:hypothetical protein